MKYEVFTSIWYWYNVQPSRPKLVLVDRNKTDDIRLKKQPITRPIFVRPNA